MTALLLALAYRSWLLTGDDEVEDDVEDRIVGRGGVDDEDAPTTSGAEPSADGADAIGDGAGR